MSSAALERLRASYETLIDALDGADADRLGKASASLAEAVEQLRSTHLGDDPQVRETLSNLVDLGHAAQSRVNFMTDALKRRLNALAQLRGDAPTATYQPGAR